MLGLSKINLKVNRDLILVVLSVAAVWFTAALVLSANSNNLSSESIVKNSIDYLNNSLLKGGQIATLTSFSEESGVIKINLTIGGNNYSSYATKDGRLFFPEGLDVGRSPAGAEAQNQDNGNPSAQATKQTCDSLTKVDKPLLEAYVVSKCPFGLQMQRAMAEAVKNIPSLADFIKVRYIGDVSNGVVTAMHGEPEATENLRQICIREEEPQKYWGYISCHIKSGGVDECLAEAGVNRSQLDQCMTGSNRGLAYAKEDFSLNTKYGITGSPTLILNGQPVSEFDFGGRSAQAIKEIVSCSSKNNQDFSSVNLDANQAATSFSLTYANPSGGSVNPNSNPNCAAQ